jgi:glycosyltransferase involved in cell wall biosynthesis
MTSPDLLGSVLIPAHNEARVIARCLDSLFDGINPDELEVVVACNGCTDGTALIARSFGHGVRVLEIEIASKAAAIRAAEGWLASYPRLYLDADVVLAGSAARAVLNRLRTGPPLAARPPIVYDTGGSSTLIRRYYRIRGRMPAVMGSLWGAGVYGLSEPGRARFDLYPDVVAEDLFVDSHFASNELEIVACRPVIVRTPRRASDLLRVLRRTYRGKALKSYANGSGPASAKPALKDVMRLALSGRSLALDAMTYSTLAVSGRALALLPGSRWERDESSRTS